jgi:hypothetical protein
MGRPERTLGHNAKRYELHLLGARGAEILGAYARCFLKIDIGI